MSYAPQSQADPGVVATNLQCVGCGYNLRSQPWDQNCPECNRPVLASAPPVGFLIAGRREANRLLAGLAVLTNSMLIPALAIDITTIVARYMHLIFNRTLAGVLFSTQGFILRFGLDYAPLLGVLAIWLIARARSWELDHSWTRLESAAFALMLSHPALLLVSLGIDHTISAGATLAYPVHLNLVLLIEALSLCWRISLLLTWVILVRRLNLRRWGWYRFFIKASIVVPLLCLLEPLHELRMFVAGLSAGWSFEIAHLTTSPLFQCFAGGELWRGNFARSLWIAVLLMIWWYVRKLNGPAAIPSSRDPSTAVSQTAPEVPR